MLQIVRSAAELADIIHRVTDTFPEEEQYVMVPVLRDAALSVLEYASLGMARYDTPYRYVLLSKALMSLNELSSHFILCKNIGVMSRQRYKELVDTGATLRDQIMNVMKDIGHVDPDEPSPF